MVYPGRGVPVGVLPCPVHARRVHPARYMPAVYTVVVNNGSFRGLPDGSSGRYSGPRKEDSSPRGVSFLGYVPVLRPFHHFYDSFD